MICEGLGFRVQVLAFEGSGFWGMLMMLVRQFFWIASVCTGYSRYSSAGLAWMRARTADTRDARPYGFLGYEIEQLMPMMLIRVIRWIARLGSGHS